MTAVLLLLFAFLAFAGGGLVLNIAKSSIQEIEAFLLFLVGAVFLSGSLVVNEIRNLAATFKKSRSQSAQHLP
jgi:hypothetical protein